jgi:hypothetical protein
MRGQNVFAQPRPKAEVTASGDDRAGLQNVMAATGLLCLDARRLDDRLWSMLPDL